MANKIGIITWHYYANFGSGLQAFALQKLISNLGYDVEIINYRNPKLGGKNSWWKIALKYFMHYTIGFLNKNIYEKTLLGTLNYQNKYLNQSKYFEEPEQITKIVKDYSCIVYGSDQIWAPNVYNPFYMGAYIPKGVRKVSYAASIGLNDIPNNLVETYKDYLSSFYAIAVRENEGKILLKNKCDINSKVVLDPTLMIDASVYSNMLRTVKGIKRNYIFCYFLNNNHNYKDKIIEYARTLNLNIIGISYKEDDCEWMTILKNIGADQFLWLINNAETIFTDSYHGSIFSLLFHKNLWIFVRFDENNPVCQNSRIRQLENNFNIGYRVVSHNSEIDDSKLINYDFFEKRLVELRHDSMLYLISALK